MDEYISEPGECSICGHSYISYCCDVTMKTTVYEPNYACFREYTKFRFCPTCAEKLATFLKDLKRENNNV